MNQGNIIDFTEYRRLHRAMTLNQAHHTLSDDLIHAIQMLIERLRDHNPLK